MFVLFFLSGASSLIFEIIFVRLLTYTFGNTAYAVSTVLAAFMGGLALGAFLLGRWVDLRPAPLLVYGVLELLVGVYALFIPGLFGLFTRCYVELYHAFQLAPAALTLVRFALAVLIILLPTVLMGGTLPALARHVAAHRRDFEAEVSRLYAWNTLGAAVGTLISTYLFIPRLGIYAAIWIACGINFFIFFCVALLRRATSPPQAEREDFPPPVSAQPGEFAGRNRAAVLLLGGFLTGAVSLAYEVVWTHVLAFLIGNTVYAFGIMLFTFLCGLGWGAQIVSRYLPTPRFWTRALAASQILLGVVIFVTLPLWNRIPDVFALGLVKAFEFEILSIAFLLVLRMAVVAWKIYRHLVAGFAWRSVAELVIEAGLLLGLLTMDTKSLWQSETTFFVAGELLRFLCAFSLLMVPALLLGVSFPLLLNLFSHSSKEAGRSVGGIYAANTLGGIVGSVLTGFAILPHFGSAVTLHMAAVADLALGLFFALWLMPLGRRRKLVLVVTTASLGALFWTRPGNWDARRMSRGSYVYFNAGWPIDRVLYFNEDVQGGLTSVVQTGSWRVLLSNGKFQGTDAGEMGAQIRFALTPILFTRGFERALVIGLGTGNTLRTVCRFPFQHIDAVELAPHIVEVARAWFESVNGRVFDRDPRVKLSIADGRNFLLLSRNRYDLVTIEITSIWISGEADLYNKEFYEVCRQHLTDRGVLQQWVQIHHMRTQDFLVILNTAARVFPHVAFFLGPEQGVLIASGSPFECDYRQIETYDGDPGVRQELELLGLPSISSLLGELMLYDDSLRRAVSLLPDVGGPGVDFVSTDFHPYLEYQTPKGNALPYDTVPRNIELMQSLRPPPLPPDLPIRNLPSDNEQNLILGFVLEERGDLRGAVESFLLVDGPARARGQAEITRIGSRAREASPHNLP